jgi:hypothetical protein
MPLSGDGSDAVPYVARMIPFDGHDFTPPGEELETHASGSVSGMVYEFDPKPAVTTSPPFEEPGVSTGWIVLHNGLGPARVAPGAILNDDAGIHPHVTGDFEDCEIVEG